MEESNSGCHGESEEDALREKPHTSDAALTQRSEREEREHVENQVRRRAVNQVSSKRSPKLAEGKAVVIEKGVSEAWYETDR